MQDLSSDDVRSIGSIHVVVPYIQWYLYSLLCICLSVPSFVPTVSVADSDVTSSSIHFTWNEYNCAELNGEFAFYNGIVTKVDQQTGRSVHQLRYASLTKYSLDPCTTYTFKVAVKNDVGIGDYSDPIEVTTSSEGRYYLLNIMDLCLP